MGDDGLSRDSDLAQLDRQNQFTDIEIELLLSGIEDYTWAIGHRCSHKTKFMALRKHSWEMICFRVNFFGNFGHEWRPSEIEQKWHSLVKIAQKKREANKTRDSAIALRQPIYQLIQPLTSIERKVLYLEEEVSWGTEMNPFLAEFDIKFKRSPAPAEIDDESEEDDKAVSKASSHRSGQPQLQGC